MCFLLGFIRVDVPGSDLICDFGWDTGGETRDLRNSEFSDCDLKDFLAGASSSSLGFSF